MSRRWLYTLGALFLLGAFGDFTVWALWSANWQAIGRILAGVSALALAWSALEMAKPDENDEPIDPSRTAYLRRPDHERAAR
jgi:hypothetical protein